MQSYIRTCTIRCVVGPHFSGNFMQLLGVWWGPPFSWKPHEIKHSNMHYLVCCGGPDFSVNLMQSYIRTCTIRCVVGPPFLMETSCNDTFKHALFGVWWGPNFSGNFMQIHTFLKIYTLLLCLTILSLHDCMTFPKKYPTRRSRERNITCSMFVHI